MLRNRPTERSGALTCPLCREGLDGALLACAGCQTEYHAACMAELGGCSTLGCSERRARAVEAAPARTAPRGATVCVECGQRVIGQNDGAVCGCEDWVHYTCRRLHRCPALAGAAVRDAASVDTSADRRWALLSRAVVPFAWGVAILAAPFTEGIWPGLVLFAVLAWSMVEVRAVAEERRQDGDLAGTSLAMVGWLLFGIPFVGALLYDRGIRRRGRRSDRG